MAKRDLSAWPHYARRALAELHLGQIRLGIRTLTLFAPRGFGKTEFIKRDLIPAATKAGLRGVYVDLWLIDSDPVESLIQQLRPESVTAVSSAPRFPRLKRVVKRLRPAGRSEAKLKASLLGQSIEIDLQKSERTTANREEALLQAFASCLEQDDRPIVLVLDEVQTLASPKYDSVVKTLRSIFQAHDARIARIFTGSSRSGLDRLFRRNKAALFQQGGADIVLPPLDQGFVELIAQWCSHQTGGRLVIERDDGYRVLRQLGHSARLFRRAIEQVLIGGAARLADAAANVQNADLVDPLLTLKLRALSDLQRVLLHAIWQSGEDLYSLDNRGAYAAALYVKGISASEVQGAIRRLERLELIYRAANGNYAIEPPELDLLIERNALRLASR